MITQYREKLLKQRFPFLENLSLDRRFEDLKAVFVRAGGAKILNARGRMEEGRSKKNERQYEGIRYYLSFTDNEMCKIPPDRISESTCGEATQFQDGTSIIDYLIDVADSEIEQLRAIVALYCNYDDLDYQVDIYPIGANSCTTILAAVRAAREQVAAELDAAIAAAIQGGS